MTAVARLAKGGDSALRRSALVWFVTTVAGMWVFVYYLIENYTVPALLHGLSAWSETNLVTGYVPGDTRTNLAIAAHLFLAVTIFGLGPFQLVPQVRTRAPGIHRWLGRLFLVSVNIVSVSGLYMIWIRGDLQVGLVEHIGTSLNGILILACAAITVRYALARNVAAHRRWAMRLFLVASGTFFIRVGYGLWFLLPESSVVPFKAFSIFVSYAQTLVPLTILEVYRRVRRRGDPLHQRWFAAGLLAMAALTAVGVREAFLVMWLPQI